MPYPGLSPPGYTYGCRRLLLLCITFITVLPTETDVKMCFILILYVEHDCRHQIIHKRQKVRASVSFNRLSFRNLTVAFRLTAITKHVLSVLLTRMRPINALAHALNRMCTIVFNAQSDRIYLG